MSQIICKETSKHFYDIAYKWDILPCIQVRSPWLNQIWEMEGQITHSDDGIGPDDGFRSLITYK